MEILPFLSELNWLAVIVAAIVFFVFGAGWYGIFGNAWMKALGKTKEDLQQGHSSFTYVYTFVAHLFKMMGFAILIKALGIDSLGGGLELGFVLGGLFKCSYVVHAVFSGRPLMLTIIDVSHDFLGALMCCGILAVWQ